LKIEKHKRQSTHVALAVVGMSGAGKSAISEYLRSKGWEYVRFGQVTIDEVERQGMPVNEKSERKIREELRERGGMAIYAKHLWPRIQAALRGGPVVIDGLYSWSEYLFLKKRLKTKLIVVAVVTARGTRYKRLATRSIRPLSQKEAERRDIGEIEKLEKAGPIAMADFTIVNEGSRKQLKAKLESLLNLVQPDVRFKNT